MVVKGQPPYYFNRFPGMVMINFLGSLAVSIYYSRHKPKIQHKIPNVNLLFIDSTPFSVYNATVFIPLFA